MKKYKCIIEYNGKNYAGMQYQEGQKTIQGEIQKALKQLTGNNIIINYSGRTDTGVHAIGQVIDFTIANKPLAEKNITNGLNFYLINEDIAIKNTEIVDINFNSRFDAKMRTYKYFINLEKTKPVHKKYTHYHFPFDINVENMNLASILFIGKHDFSAFRSKECQSKNPLRTISEITLDLKNNELIITIKAKSFLHNMVRIVCGTLLDVGRGAIMPNKIEEIIKSKQRTKAGRTLPPHGLYFWQVEF